MAWQRSVIDGIRRDKFGTGSSKAKVLTVEVHRALEKLSSEYYHDVQFIEELIQNAEDNTYGIDVRPSLEFLLTNADVAEKGVSATLLVLNNESGLLVPDVMALCSVKNSTKIGRKGIGFKSVFTVCKTPVIISNFASTSKMNQMKRRDWDTLSQIGQTHRRTRQFDLPVAETSCPIL
ncbi:unnamed protein product [Calypogeia fissa]